MSDDLEVPVAVTPVSDEPPRNKYPPPVGREYHKQQWVRLGGRYAAFIRGEITIDDLDEEELARGRLRDKNGQFNGRAPKVIPAAFLEGVRQRHQRVMEQRIKYGADMALKVMFELMSDPNVESNVRLNAAKEWVNRHQGKVPDKIIHAEEDPFEALYREILADPEGLESFVPVPAEPLLP